MEQNQETNQRPPDPTQLPQKRQSGEGDGGRDVKRTKEDGPATNSPDDVAATRLAKLEDALRDPGFLGTLTAALSSTATDDDPCAASAADKDPAAAKAARQARLKLFALAYAPFVRIAVSTGGSDSAENSVAGSTALYLEWTDAQKYLGSSAYPDFCRMQNRLRATEQQELKALKLATAKSESFRPEHTFARDYFLLSNLYAKIANKIYKNNPPQGYGLRSIGLVDPEGLFNAPKFKPLRDRYVSELSAALKLAVNPAAIKAHVRYDVILSDIQSVSTSIPCISKRKFGQPHSVGALFEDGPHDWHLSRLLLEAACNTLTLDKIPRIQGLEDAVTVLSSLRSRFDRSAANPHLEAIIPLERELRRQTAKERQVDYSVLGGMMSESLSATAGAPKPFRTAAWTGGPAATEYKILVKRILSSSQQGFNLVLAAAGVTAEMLMEVGRSAARIAVESAPRSQLERKLFDKRDDGDDNDESRASQPFHAFAQTKSFNLSACDRTPRMTAQTQLDTWRAENPDVFDPPPPGASQADLKPRGTKKTNMSDALGEVQKLIQNNLDSVVSDKRALKMTAAALSAGLVRGKWQSGWFLSAALERFTRAMARVYLNRAELDGVYEQVMRVVYCSFLVAWLAPTAGIAGMIYDSEIELLTLTSNIPHLGQVVIGEVSKDVHGGIFSIEFLTTKYASHRVRDVTWIGETGGIDPRHYMYGIQLQKEICGETLTCGGRRLVYQPGQRHGNENNKITVNVLLRRNPLQLKDGLSKETAFGCLYTIFQYLFIAGLELSAARLFILAHVDDKPSRGKGLTSLILSDENGVVVTQEVVGDVDGEEIGAEREEIGLEGVGAARAQSG